MVGAVPNGSLRVVDVAETRQTTNSREKYRVRRRQQIACKLQFAGIATPRPATRGDNCPIPSPSARSGTPRLLPDPAAPAGHQTEESHPWIRPNYPMKAGAAFLPSPQP